MAYIKTTWKDRLVERPNTFEVQENPDGTITLIPKPGTVTQAGTPVNATNLNKIEDGIATLENNVMTHQAETASDGVHGIKDIKVVSFGATSTITANSTTHVVLSIATPSGYELIGYILDGLYTGADKSNYYQNLVASVVRSNDPFVAVRSFRATDVSVYVAIKGLYIKI